MELTKEKTFYPAHQQMKYLYLQADIEVLIQQLQALKHQKDQTPV